ncbi:unnamed protein product [Pleuronectes platessa]|uniref:Uncharacterized protein n=1 Tax=Pleuronectes platessa TaxID=8262 RepID=A0A9N7YHF4_PLEPL|nr:unnamed protein product [Pleuronectes platessa]
MRTERQMKRLDGRGRGGRGGGGGGGGRGGGGEMEELLESWSEMLQHGDPPPVGLQREHDEDRETDEEPAAAERRLPGIGDCHCFMGADEKVGSADERGDEGGSVHLSDASVTGPSERGRRGRGEEEVSMKKTERGRAEGGGRGRQCGSLGKHQDQFWPICWFSCQSERLIPPPRDGSHPETRDPAMWTISLPKMERDNGGEEEMDGALSGDSRKDAARSGTGWTLCEARRSLVEIFRGTLSAHAKPLVFFHLLWLTAPKLLGRLAKLLHII